MTVALATGVFLIVVGFWLLIGLVLSVIVDKVRRGAEERRHLALASEATHATRDYRAVRRQVMQQAHDDLSSDRYGAYERLLGPDEDPNMP
jgi:hypothetical protein